MKGLINKLNWRSLGAELVIVFVGLFAALQLDDWRQQREFREAETRYLERLRDDLQGFLAFSDDMLPFLERNGDAVLHVYQSLAAGRILEDDVTRFERGLIYVGHLPAIQMHRTAYDEMVASGMFARLGSETLRREIAALYATQVVVDKNFSWWRRSVGELEVELLPLVTLYSEDETETLFGFIEEPVRRVKFDFDELAANLTLRNGYYWAADTHSDWVLWTGRLTEQAERALAVMDEELAQR